MVQNRCDKQKHCTAPTVNILGMEYRIEVHNIANLATKAEVQAVTDNLYKGNLLKNSNFKLNTNGLSEYTANGMCVDSWRFNTTGGGSLTVDTTHYTDIYQGFSALRIGETYTLSVEVDGVRHSNQLTGVNYLQNILLGNITMFYIQNSGNDLIVFRVNSKALSATIREVLMMYLPTSLLLIQQRMESNDGKLYSESYQK